MHGLAGIWGSGRVSPTLGRRPVPLSLSCGPVNEEATYGPGAGEGGLMDAKATPASWEQRGNILSRTTGQRQTGRTCTFHDLSAARSNTHDATPQTGFREAGGFKELETVETR